MPRRHGLLLAAALPMAGCSSGSPAGDAPAGEAIECALQGAAAFARDCTVERVSESGTLMLVVRHPGGGFRRFKVLNDGHGVAVADGADVAAVSLSGDILDVAVGKDRYRFPTTRKAS